MSTSIGGPRSVEASLARAPCTWERRASSTSRSAIWIEPAKGIASSAPTMPSSDEPISTLVSTMKGETETDFFITIGWMIWFSTCW